MEQPMGKRGFTFFEILVVTILIGVMMAIMIPKVRGSFDSVNVRSARVAIANLVVKARAAAVQRGCTATITFTSGTTGTMSISICNVNGSGSTTLGGVDSVAARYKVTLTPSLATLKYDPRGLSVGYTAATIKVTSNSVTDSVYIDQIGKVVH